MASAAPPVKDPNVYGIDMPASKEFIADNRTVDDIARFIGCDKLFYQDLDDLIDSVKNENSTITGFDSSCFDGEYVTGDVNDEYLVALDELRNDAEKRKQTKTDDTFDEVVVY